MALCAFWPATADAAPVSVTLDYLHGVDMFLTSTDPDVMLVAASGHDYSMPLASTVPEPSTPLLLTLSIATLAGWRRKSR